MRRVLNQSVPSSDYLLNADRHTDLDLFAQIAVQDENALAELYKRYRNQVFRFALYQTQDENAAEEILQDVFLAAWQRAAEFRGKASVKTWLLRVAYYRSATWLAKQKKPVELESLEILPSIRPGPDDEAVTSWQSEQVQQALRSLTPKHRTAVVLIFYHELTYKEAAKVVDCPVGTMKSRINQALGQVSRLLAASGYTHDS